LGKCKKVYVDSMAHLDRDFGGIVLRVVEFRVNVCTKTVVGRKKVIRKVPVGYEEREVEEDIVEWDCGESLLKRAKEHAKEKFND